MTVPCGMGCFNCKMLEAKGNLDWRKKAAEKFHLEFEKAYCDGGCREIAGKYPFIGPGKVCAVYKCSRERQVTFCDECRDFPCDHSHPHQGPVSSNVCADFSHAYWSAILPGRRSSNLCCLR